MNTNNDFTEVQIDDLFMMKFYNVRGDLESIGEAIAVRRCMSYFVVNHGGREYKFRYDGARYGKYDYYTDHVTLHLQTPEILQEWHHNCRLRRVQNLLKIVPLGGLTTDELSTMGDILASYRKKNKEDKHE